MCHVLIIEDEPLVAMVLEDILMDGGATSVFIAATEREAVASAIARAPDVITSDVKLTEGTGPQAVRRIIDALGDVPVIFITGSPEDCEPCEPPGRVLIAGVHTRGRCGIPRAIFSLTRDTYKSPRCPHVAPPIDTTGERQRRSRQ